ncbi:hypothetical protein COO60DRAFT_6584 [Scenedesmus sp. NREL 46B-D3]|nr:hypothetical protein COO60DRAFT_6584 [Scenedesmus sp. NREL 46B-D3]
MLLQPTMGSKLAVSQAQVRLQLSTSLLLYVSFAALQARLHLQRLGATTRRSCSERRNIAAVLLATTLPCICHAPAAVSAHHHSINAVPAPTAPGSVRSKPSCLRPHEPHGSASMYASLHTHTAHPHCSQSASSASHSRRHMTLACAHAQHPPCHSTGIGSKASAHRCVIGKSRSL